MDNIDAQAAPCGFLCKEVVFAILLRDHRRGKLFPQKLGQPFHPFFDRSGEQQLFLQRELVSLPLAKDESRLADELEYVRQTFD